MAEPIFIQALWRTGSTYMFGKFRSREELRCYFEPLHESLFCKTKEKLLDDYKRASQKFDHKSVSHNYYEEFNVRAEGGVENFQRRFSIEKYVLAANDEDENLRKYTQSLIDQAKTKGQQPVLQFNRGILRGEWMKRHFGGTHVYLNRNPADMLSSYKKNGYYLPMYLSIIGQNAEHPVFNEAAKYFDVAKFDHSDICDERKHIATFTNFSRKAKNLSEQDERDLVEFFWALGLAAATRYADVIIDTDQIMRAGHKVLHDTVESSTGCNLNFEDFVATGVKDKGRQSFSVSNQMRSIVQQSTDILHPNWSRLARLSIADLTSYNLIETLAA